MDSLCLPHHETISCTIINEGFSTLRRPWIQLQSFGWQKLSLYFFADFYLKSSKTFNFIFALKILFWKFQKINYLLLPHFISILFYIISSFLFIFYSYNFSQTEGIWPIMNSILLCILQNN